MMKTNTVTEFCYEELISMNAELASANAKLVSEISSLREELKGALSQIEWFKRQVFGTKSERFVTPDVTTLPLFSPTSLLSSEIQEKVPSSEEVLVYARKPRGKTTELGSNEESGLRFDDGVEIVTEYVYPPEVKDLSDSAYEIIGKEISDRLASSVSKTFVHRRVFVKVKLKATDNLPAVVLHDNLPQILKAPVPTQVLPRSYMSVSFLVDMILDKVLYSMPLYRQHQRLKREGYHISRSGLISNFIKGCLLLEGVVEAMHISIIAGGYVSIDETPILVGRDKASGKMHKGYVWPIYGELNEIVYNYNASRSTSVIKELLGDSFKGVLLSDGYSAYDSYTNAVKESGQTENVTHATCWVHARRKFVILEQKHPDVYNAAMEYFQSLYAIEDSLKGKPYQDIACGREEKSLSIVEEYFNWIKSFSGNPDIAANKDLRNALSYSLEREDSMKVFLRNPEVSMDTNHLEREIRPIAIGRKNWMFCWEEIGAKSLCLAQSLVRTCILHDINPRVYFIDVLQRLTTDFAEAKDVSELIPRLWKDSFGKTPLCCPSVAALRNRSP